MSFREEYSFHKIMQTDIEDEHYIYHFCYKFFDPFELHKRISRSVSSCRRSTRVQGCYFFN